MHTFGTLGQQNVVVFYRMNYIGSMQHMLRSPKAVFNKHQKTKSRATKNVLNHPTKQLI